MNEPVLKFYNFELKKLNTLNTFRHYLNKVRVVFPENGLRSSLYHTHNIYSIDKITEITLSLAVNM